MSECNNEQCKAVEDVASTYIKMYEKSVIEIQKLQKIIDLQDELISQYRSSTNRYIGISKTEEMDEIKRKLKELRNE